MEEFLNASQAAKELCVTQPTISKWFDDGLFPNGFKIKSTIRIPLSDIEALKHGKKEVV